MIGKETRNPCDVCKYRDIGNCDGCVLYIIYSTGECYNDDCFVNYECGCLLGLENVCKASTAYVEEETDEESE